MITVAQLLKELNETAHPEAYFLAYGIDGTYDNRLGALNSYLCFRLGREVYAYANRVQDPKHRNATEYPTKLLLWLKSSGSNLTFSSRQELSETLRDAVLSIKSKIASPVTAPIELLRSFRDAQKDARKADVSLATAKHWVVKHHASITELMPIVDSEYVSDETVKGLLYNIDGLNHWASELKYALHKVERADATLEAVATAIDEYLGEQGQ